IKGLGEGRIAEAAFGQAAMQRHLAALEALDADARARGLALAAAATGLASARADAATDAAALLAGARPIGEFVQLHRLSPVTSCTRTRCATLAIIPRTCGVSGRSTTRPMRLSPSPINVSR